MGTAFVFDPEGNYRKVRKIRESGSMPVAGLRYVASVTGPYKLIEIVDFEGLGQLADRLDSMHGGGGSGDPPNLIAYQVAKVRRSTYRAHTAFVRIDVTVANPAELLDQIRTAIGPDSDDGVEADVVVGDCDILACVVDDDEETLGTKILDIRRIEGVKRTVTLRVIDYVSISANAPEDHQVSAMD